MARVLAVCVSSNRQEPKKPVAEARFIEGKGIDGDSHFGISSRQVSLLRYEDIKLAEKEAGFSFPPGSLAENLVVEGLPDQIPLESRLKIGRDVVLLVIEKGKKPDEPHTYDYRGWCLLPKVGYFLEVVNGGIVKPGDEVVLEGD
ncbi:MAG TPA: MOSC domain-containing protein [Acetomicrobium flavidum]|uniref:MOSC domain-containing protein YiiM n=1 Tax=Acetomicrobium flavidum TaxID=49896 RepID=A0ABY1JAJ3_9BACT|nr:MOSC domain-containing protein YiiM [Acetomicrobium flavidum]HPU68973.1 MOSC domain-containing protein [Acetomicrobium flavidum]